MPRYHCSYSSPAAAAADALDEIHRRGTLVWGGDQEGVRPFVFPDPKDPKHLIGFEVDLAELLAAELGVKAQFQQGQWENVPQMLGSQIDVALNGFERTPTRLRDYLCTRPYYAFGLQLMAQRDGPLKSWKQLKPAKPDGSPWRGRRAGRLGGRNYLNELRDQEGYQVEVVAYNGNTDPMEHVQTGVLDATVADDCVANYYVDRFSRIETHRLAGRRRLLRGASVAGTKPLAGSTEYGLGKIHRRRPTERAVRPLESGRPLPRCWCCATSRKFPPAESLSFWEVLRAICPRCSKPPA